MVTTILGISIQKVIKLGNINNVPYMLSRIKNWKISKIDNDLPNAHLFRIQVVLE